MAKKEQQPKRLSYYNEALDAEIHDMAETNYSAEKGNSLFPYLPFVHSRPFNEFTPDMSADDKKLAYRIYANRYIKARFPKFFNDYSMWLAGFFAFLGICLGLAIIGIIILAVSVPNYTGMTAAEITIAKASWESSAIAGGILIGFGGFLFLLWVLLDVFKLHWYFTIRLRHVYRVATDSEIANENADRDLHEVIS